RAVEEEGELEPPPVRLAVKRRLHTARSKRAAEKPLAVREHRPHRQVALPLHTVVADLTGHDVARARDRRVVDGDKVEGRRTGGRGAEPKRRPTARLLAG